jgi:hypothetical protein
MKLAFGSMPYLRRLGIKPRRPHTFKSVNVSIISSATGTYNHDVPITAGGDFLVDSIVVNARFPYAAGPDGWWGLETLNESKKYYNVYGAMTNEPLSGDGDFAPFMASISQPNAMCLPWIIKAGDILRIFYKSKAGSSPVGTNQVVVNGYLLDSFGQESPFTPFIWTLADSDLTTGTYGEQSHMTISGTSDFICTYIGAKNEWEIGQGVLADVRLEHADEVGGCRLWQRQTYNGQGNILRNMNAATEGHLPEPFIVRNNTTVTMMYDNASSPPSTIRIPQLCLFGYFVNPLVFPNADLFRGILL